MDSKNNGGPAFPVSFSPDYPNEITGGMSLRDYFAAKAMQGEIAASCNNSRRPEQEELARWSYQVADAMLRARATGSAD